MTKAELIADIASSAGLSKKDAGIVLETFVESIRKSLAFDKRAVIPGIGAISVKSRPARDGRNPRTGEKIKIAAGNKFAFSAAKELKDAV